MTTLELQALLQFRTFYLNNTITRYSFSYDEINKNDKAIGHYKLVESENKLQIEMHLDDFDPVLFDISVIEQPLSINLFSSGKNEPFMTLREAS